MTITIYCIPGKDAEGGWGYKVSSNDRLIPKYFAPVKHTGMVSHDVLAHIHHNPDIDCILDELIALGVQDYYAYFSMFSLINLWSGWALNDIRPATFKYKQEVKKEYLELASVALGMGLDSNWVEHDRKSKFEDWVDRYKDVLIETTAKALTKGWRIGKDAYHYPENALKIMDYLENTLALVNNQPDSKVLTLTENSPGLMFKIKPHLGHIDCTIKEGDVYLEYINGKGYIGHIAP